MIRVMAAVGILALGGQGTPKAISPAEAKAHVGEAVTVMGRVTGVTVSDKRHATLITFGKGYPEQVFAAVIPASAEARFSNLKALVGKTALVKGTVRLHQGKPEIVLESAEQLNVVV